MSSLQCALVGLVLWLSSFQPARADIYTYTATDGTILLSNVPTDNRYALLISTSDPPAGSLRAAPAYRGGSRPASKARYDQMVDEVSRASGVESALLHAVISVESHYNHKALSPKGATGLMQLMPQTAKRYGVADSYDPMQNVQGGARYLRDLLQMFDNNTSLALAAYNAGENAVRKHGNRIPPYRETLNYVPRVLDFYQRYQARLPAGAD